MQPLPLLAFGFESLPMLGWLAAATAPWLIPLLEADSFEQPLVLVARFHLRIRSIGL
jgi:hypothetical protein